MSGQPPTAQPLPPQGGPGVPMGPRPSQAGDGLVLGFGITGLVIGILSLMLSFVTCLGAFAIFPGAVATVFSAVATFIGFANKSRNVGLAVAALVVSLAAVGGGVYQRNWIVKKARQGVKTVGDEVRKGIKKGIEDAKKKTK